MKILVACEESQVVCKAFRGKGHEAYSCDIIDCSGGHPEWHIKRDVLEIINDGWDMMIAFPPCTHLCVSGSRWFPQKIADGRQQQGIDFFMAIINANIDKIAVENPVGIMSSKYRKPDQIINPYQFGHPEQKKTCLWLKNLPLLTETDNVYDYMMTLPKKDRTRIHWLGSGKSAERSKTYEGIGKAMADQYIAFINSDMTVSEWEKSFNNLDILRSGLLR